MGRPVYIWRGGPFICQDFVPSSCSSGTGLSCCYCCCCCAVDDDLHRMKLLNLLVEDAAEESEALVREGSEM